MKPTSVMSKNRRSSKLKDTQEQTVHVKWECLMLILGEITQKYGISLIRKCKNCKFITFLISLV